MYRIVSLAIYYFLRKAEIDFVNNLDIFKIGMSWGGVNSLAVVYPDLTRPNQDFSGRIVRLNIGLEMVDDLIADLDQALDKIVWMDKKAIRETKNFLLSYQYVEIFLSCFSLSLYQGFNYGL